MKARYFFLIVASAILFISYFIFSSDYPTLEDLIRNEYKSQQVEIFRKGEKDALIFVLSKKNYYNLKSVYARKKVTGWQIDNVSAELNLAKLKGPAILPNKVLFKLDKDSWMMYGVTPSQEIESITIDSNAAAMLPFTSYFKGYSEQELTIWYFTADEAFDPNKVEYRLKK